MKSILEKLATSLGRRDEIPNQLLAESLSRKNDVHSIAELVKHLKLHPDKNIQNDCIKVLYEIGEQKPKLITVYCSSFLEVLNSKNNRLVWGAMTALDTITEIEPDQIFKSLPQILETADKGSVITKDHAVRILIKLAGMRKYADSIFPLLMEQLKSCPIKQLPMYAERSLDIIYSESKEVFMKLLFDRIAECEKDSQTIRIEKLIRKANKI